MTSQLVIITHIYYVPIVVVDSWIFAVLWGSKFIPIFLKATAYETSTCQISDMKVEDAKLFHTWTHDSNANHVYKICKSLKMWKTMRKNLHM